MLAGNWKNNDIITYCGCNGINTEGANVLIKRGTNILAHRNFEDIDTENAIITKMLVIIQGFKCSGREDLFGTAI